MADIFFSSDHHFGHANIIGFASRPFSSSQEMDEKLIQLHNEWVRPSDHWYCLGDVSMMRPRLIKGILERMNGHKRLVRGNHDIYKTKEYIEVGFEEIYGIRVLDNILFSHIPIHPLSLGGFKANVHGHIHTQPDFPPVMRIDKTTQEVKWIPYINISVERTNYHPLSLEDLRMTIREAYNGEQEKAKAGKGRGESSPSEVL